MTSIWLGLTCFWGLSDPKAIWVVFRPNGYKEPQFGLPDLVVLKHFVVSAWSFIVMDLYGHFFFLMILNLGWRDYVCDGVRPWLSSPGPLLELLLVVTDLYLTGLEFQCFLNISVGRPGGYLSVFPINRWSHCILHPNLKMAVHLANWYSMDLQSLPPSWSPLLPIIF